MVDRTRLEEIVRGFEGKRILVVGDVMLDRFYSGPVRIKSENPVGNMRVDLTKDVPGGAGNVAANVAALDGQATLYGLIGSEEAGESLKRVLGEKEVSFHYAHEGQTIVKVRLYSQGHPTYGLDIGEAEGTLVPISEQNETIFYNAIEDAVENRGVDAIVLSDYNKRVLRGGLAGKVIGLGGSYDIPVFADFKPGNAALFRGCPTMKINESEARELSGMPKESIEYVAARCAYITGSTNIVITRGHEGSVVYDGEMHVIPTKEVGVSDVTGAGDTVIATLALAKVSGASILEAAEIANYAAACVVSKPGTATLTRQSLLDMFHQ